MTNKKPALETITTADLFKQKDGASIANSKLISDQKAENRGGRGLNNLADKNDLPLHPAALRAKSYYGFTKLPLLPAGAQLTKQQKFNLAQLSYLYSELADTERAIAKVSQYLPKLKGISGYLTDELLEKHDKLKEQLSEIIHRQLSSFSTAKS